MKKAVKIASELHFSNRIPVVSKNGKPLMPCKPSKARNIMPGLDGLVKDAVLHHHERPDRKGYPDGIEPTVSALIVAVADAWDALTASRPYRREPFSRQQALDEVSRWAPPALVEVLEEIG